MLLEGPFIDFYFSHLHASSLCISFPLIIAPVAHLFCEHSVKQFNEKELKISFLSEKINISSSN
ncbi:hypothetical protein AOA13_106c [Listeria monocytogenes]|nr:hypothetical protein AOB47_336c [Listeria monocytogenes]KSZ48445.1 hypothetical protein AOA13_106c [Listeria monocytogenes]